MSGPTPSFSLPRDVFELMTTVVGWEKFLGFDGHAEPSYNPLINLTCWMEPHGLGTNTGIEALRTATVTTAEPDYDLFFDGDDPNALLIELYDRFTVYGVGIVGDQRLQCQNVAQFLGPNWDNTNPWIIYVSL